MSPEQTSPAQETTDINMTQGQKTGWVLAGSIGAIVFGVISIKDGVIITGCLAIASGLSFLEFIPVIEKHVFKGKNRARGISLILFVITFCIWCWEPNKVHLNVLEKAVENKNWSRADQLAKADNFSAGDSTLIRLIKQTIDSAFTAIEQEKVARETIGNASMFFADKKWKEVIDKLQTLPVGHPLYDTAKQLIYIAKYGLAAECYEKEDYKGAVEILDSLMQTSHPDDSAAKALFADATDRMIAANNAEMKSNLEQAQINTHKQMIDEQFSLWNGSHKNLVKYVKDRMNDPGSFKHVETGYADKGDHLIVSMKFRGKNAFGGVITKVIDAKVGMDGEILSVLE